ncbi:MAG: diguanylate cyclase [Planctomycetes bacterium]|nr:diguanylate cyclase [Planctomycetota bacterium]
MGLILILDGPGSGRAYALTGPITLGRDATNTIVVDDRRIAAAQIRIRRDGARALVTNLGPDRSVTVNGQILHEESALKHGDVIEIADSRLLFSDESATAQPIVPALAPSPAAAGEGRGGGMLAPPTPPALAPSPSPAAAGEGRGEGMSAPPSPPASSPASPPPSPLAPPLPADAFVESRHRTYESAADVVEAAQHLEKPFARLATLYKATHAISALCDWDQLLRTVLDLVLEEIEADRGTVLIMDAERGELVPAATRTREGVAPGEESAAPRTILAEVCRTGEAVSTSDALADPRFAGGASIIGQQIRSAMCVPLARRDRLIGVIYVDRISHARRPFSEGDMDLLVGIGLQAGIALDNASSYERAQRYSRNFASLQRAILWLGAYLAREPILKEAVAFVCSNLKCTKVSILLLDPAGESAVMGHATGIDRELWPEIRVFPGRGLAGRVLGSAQPLLCPDPQTGRHPEGIGYVRKVKYSTNSFAIVPIPKRIEGQPHATKPMGVINAADKLGGKNFTAEDLEILSLLAAQVGMALVNASLYERATVDHLTRLYTRPCFFQEGEKLLEAAVRRRSPLSVLMLDLDHFKSINDTYGHAAGDSVLRVLGTILKECLRAADVGCRMGGEEFAALLPGTAREGALGVAERVRAAVANFPFELDGKAVRVSISVGLAFPREGDTIETVLARADKALYRAKTAGRNRVEEG